MTAKMPKPNSPLSAPRRIPKAGSEIGMEDPAAVEENGQETGGEHSQAERGSQRNRHQEWQQSSRLGRGAQGMRPGDATLDGMPP